MRQLEIIVRGKPMSGKTTLASKLAMWLFRDGHTVNLVESDNPHFDAREASTRKLDPVSVAIRTEQAPRELGETELAERVTVSAMTADGAREAWDTSRARLEAARPIIEGRAVGGVTEREIRFAADALFARVAYNLAHPEVGFVADPVGEELARLMESTGVIMPEKAFDAVRAEFDRMWAKAGRKPV